MGPLTILTKVSCIINSLILSSLALHSLVLNILLESRTPLQSGELSSTSQRESICLEPFSLLYLGRAQSSLGLFREYTANKIKCDHSKPFTEGQRDTTWFTH